jgi:hypothetical protein
MAVTIIGSTLVGVGENLIGLAAFLELFLGFGIVRVAVGVAVLISPSEAVRSTLRIS